MKKKKKKRPKKRRTNRPGRPIDKYDRKKIYRTLNIWASGSFTGLRTKALVLLAWGSGLRLAEICALDLSQVVVDRQKKNVRIRTTAYLRKPQSKATKAEGVFIITKSARTALRAYIKELYARKWIPFPPSRNAPLFVTIKPRNGENKSAHDRLSPRTAQHNFLQVQKMAGIDDPYRFHDMRHDGFTRMADVTDGNVFRVAAWGRLKGVNTARRYVHESTQTLKEMAEIASRLD